MTSSNLIGDRIRFIRKEESLSQKSFARELGVTQNQIVSIENNISIPSDSLVKLISIKYNVFQEWLFLGKGEIYSMPSYIKSIPIDDVFREYKNIKNRFESKIDSGTATTVKSISTMVECFEHFVSMISLSDELTKSEKLYLDQLDLIFETLYYYTLQCAPPKKGCIKGNYTLYSNREDQINDVKETLCQSLNNIYDIFQNDMKKVI